ncbi:hypothetical protein SAMN05192549_104416 [Duganella sacchari]|uniref:Uncharacterized protein n=1 Tax=Duganella sacchari TaxID=551987 RepID=A0A1M7P4Z7_9BURK|nr:hypothetical protein [Duganella sacchari]SHN11673.1 hypothetical protein SAMN05192549_104416 [Duganella sacchari]
MNAVETQLLSQMLLDHCQGRMMKRLSWGLVLCAAGVLGASHYLEAPVFGNVLFLVLICGLGYLWCGSFLKSAIQQNRPANAVLVPGLRANLMRLTALLYIACTLATGALGWLLLGHPGYVLLTGAALGVYSLFTSRYAWLNTLPSFIMIIFFSINNRNATILDVITGLMGEPLLTFLGVIVLTWLGWLGLQAAFPQGGDKHWRWLSCQARQRAMNRGELLNSEPGAGIRWLAWLRGPYNAALRADSRKGADQGRQMAHTLGTSAHDGVTIAYVILSAVVMAMFAHHWAASKDPVFMLVICMTMQGVLMQSALVYISSIINRAGRYGTEQSLYLLTPAAPAPAGCNRSLMRILLFRTLRLWLLCSLGIVVIDIAAQGRLEVRGTTYLLAMMMLPLTGLVLRNYATARRQSTDWLAIIGTTMMIFLYVALALFAQDHPGLPLFWVGSAVGVAALVGLRLRWQHVMQLPPVLPVGRLVA